MFNPRQSRTYLLFSPSIFYNNLNNNNNNNNHTNQVEEQNVDDDDDKPPVDVDENLLTTDIEKTPYSSPQSQSQSQQQSQEEEEKEEEEEDDDDDDDFLKVKNIVKNVKNVKDDDVLDVEFNGKGNWNWNGNGKDGKGKGKSKTRTEIKTKTKEKIKEKEKEKDQRSTTTINTTTSTDTNLNNNPNNPNLSNSISISEIYFSSLYNVGIESSSTSKSTLKETSTLKEKTIKIKNKSGSGDGGGGGGDDDGDGDGNGGGLDGDEQTPKTAPVVQPPTYAQFVEYLHQAFPPSSSSGSTFPSASSYVASTSSTPFSFLNENFQELLQTTQSIDTKYSKTIPKFLFPDKQDEDPASIEKITSSRAKTSLTNNKGKEKAEAAAASSQSSVSDKAAMIATVMALRGTKLNASPKKEKKAGIKLDNKESDRENDGDGDGDGSPGETTLTEREQEFVMLGSNDWLIRRMEEWEQSMRKKSLNQKKIENTKEKKEKVNTDVMELDLEGDVATVNGTEKGKNKGKERERVSEGHNNEDEEFDRERELRKWVEGLEVRDWKLQMLLILHSLKLHQASVATTVASASSKRINRLSSSSSSCLLPNGEETNHGNRKRKRSSLFDNGSISTSRASSSEPGDEITRDETNDREIKAQREFKQVKMLENRLQKLLELVEMWEINNDSSPNRNKHANGDGDGFSANVLNSQNGRKQTTKSSTVPPATSKGANNSRSENRSQKKNQATGEFEEGLYLTTNQKWWLNIVEKWYSSTLDSSSIITPKAKRRRKGETSTEDEQDDDPEEDLGSRLRNIVFPNLFLDPEVEKRRDKFLKRMGLGPLHGGTRSKGRGSMEGEGARLSDQNMEGVVNGFEKEVEGGSRRKSSSSTTPTRDLSSTTSSSPFYTDGEIGLDQGDGMTAARSLKSLDREKRRRDKEKKKREEKEKKEMGLMGLGSPTMVRLRKVEWERECNGGNDRDRKRGKKRKSKEDEMDIDHEADAEETRMAARRSKSKTPKERTLEDVFEIPGWSPESLITTPNVLESFSSTSQSKRPAESRTRPLPNPLQPNLSKSLSKRKVVQSEGSKAISAHLASNRAVLHDPDPAKRAFQRTRSSLLRAGMINTSGSTSSLGRTKSLTSSSKMRADFGRTSSANSLAAGSTSTTSFHRTLSRTNSSTMNSTTNTNANSGHARSLSRQNSLGPNGLTSTSSRLTAESIFANGVAGKREVTFGGGGNEAVPRKRKSTSDGGGVREGESQQNGGGIMDSVFKKGGLRQKSTANLIDTYNTSSSTPSPDPGSATPHDPSELIAAFSSNPAVASPPSLPNNLELESGTANQQDPQQQSLVIKKRSVSTAQILGAGFNLKGGRK